MSLPKSTIAPSDLPFHSDPTEHALNLVATMLATLVSKRKAVEITAEPTPTHTLIRVTVDDADMGRVVGKQGHTAQAMRLLIAAHSKRVGRLYRLDIDIPGAQVPGSSAA